MTLTAANWSQADRVMADMRARARSLGLGDGWSRELAPRVLPAGWAMERGPDDFVPAVFRCHGLAVLWSAAVEDDGRRWIHVSVSHAARLPRWSELREVKDVLIGRDRHAYQVLPPESEYVNLHPHCLHLWAPIDGPVLPDFRRGLGTI